MLVASLENCRRLYKLSGWDDTEKHWTAKDTITHRGHRMYGDVPAYSLGYLIRKLPQASVVSLEDGRGKVNGYYADSFKLRDRKGVPKRFEADSPEDALALLAIKLIESGLM